MRMMITASLIAALAGSAYAADDKAKSSAEKTSDGFGNLLKGMGQEVKKAGGGDAKKSDKAAKQSKEDKK